MSTKNKIETKVEVDDSEVAKLTGVERAVAGITSAFSLLTRAAGLAATALAAAYVAGDRFSSSVAMMERVAKSTGSTVQQVQLLETAYGRVGGSSASAATSLQKMNAALARQDPALKALGVNATSAFEALLQISDLTQGSGQSDAKQTVLTHLLGADAAASLIALGNARDVLRDINDQLERNKGIISNVDTATASRFNARSDDYKGRIGGAKTAIGRFSSRFLLYLDDVISGRMKAPPTAFHLLGMAAGRGIYANDLSVDGTTVRPAGAPAPDWQAALDSLMNQGRQKKPAQLPGGGFAGWAGFANPAFSAMRMLAPSGQPGYGGFAGWAGFANRPAAFARMMASGGDEGAAKALGRNVQMVERMASGVTSGFENMFNSIFMIQRRSKNVVVALFQDLFNGIMSGVQQRAGAALGGWLVDLGLSFIPGGSAAKNASGKLTSGAPVVINYSSLTAPSLVDAARSPSGELYRANQVLRQQAAVR